MITPETKPLTLTQARRLLETDPGCWIAQDYDRRRRSLFYTSGTNVADGIYPQRITPATIERLEQDGLITYDYHSKNSDGSHPASIYKPVHQLRSSGG